MIRIGKHHIVISLGFMLIFGITIFWFTAPTLSSLAVNKKAFYDKQAELNLIYQKTDALRSAQKKQDQYKEAVDRVATWWPDNQDISKFIIQTEEMAKKNNTVISNFSISQPVAVKKPIEEEKETKDAKSDAASQATNKKTPAKPVKKSSQFNFSYQSTYPVAHSILEAMEGFDRYNTVDSVNMIVNEKQEVSTSLVGRIYYGN